MSISELNHFMTYVLEGWMLFSAGFVGIGFISFVSRRIQEDIEAEALALSEGQTLEAGQTVEEAVQAVLSTPFAESQSDSPSQPTPPPTDTGSDEPAEPSDTPTEEESEAARLEEVAAVSAQLAKMKEKMKEQQKDKQNSASSVSVRPSNNS